MDLLSLEAKVTAALISALVAVVLAILSFIRGLVLARERAHHEKQIAEMRIEHEKALEKLSLTFQIRAEEARETLKLRVADIQQRSRSISEGIGAIQAVKDAITTIADSTDTSLSIEDARGMVVEASDRLAEIYQRVGGDLNDEARDCIHDAKRDAREIKAMLQQAGLRSNSRWLGSEVRDQLPWLHQLLTDKQQILRDVKSTLLLSEGLSGEDA